MNRIIYLFLFLLVSSCISNEKKSFEYLGYLTESDSLNTIQEFIAVNESELITSDDEYISLGHLERRVFIKMRLFGDVDSNSPIKISFDNPMLNEIEIYDDKGDIIKLLGRINFNKSDFKSFFNISEVPKNDSNTYYAKVQTFGSVNIPIGLPSSEPGQISIDERNVLFGVYFGIVLAMFFYNLFLWTSTKDNLYGLYISYIFAVGMTQGILTGYFDVYLWPENLFLKQYSFYLSTVIVNIVGLYYSLRFLKIGLLNSTLYKSGIVIILVYVVVFVSFLVDFGPINSKIRILQVFLGIVPLYLVGISTYSLRKGYRPARFFLISWSLLIVSMIIFLLNDLNILSHNFFTNYIFIFGSAFEALLLSFALADKINILKKEKEQLERLRVLGINESLVREQNSMLEAQVKIRTDELELVLRNLQNTQSQLVNQEKMASLGQLTAGIAHEINNPINFVSSNITPLKRDIKDIMEIIGFYRSKGELEFYDASKKEAKDLEEELELDYVLDEVDQLLKGMDDGARRTVEIVKGLRIFSRVDEQDVKKVDLHDGINSTIILLNSTMPTRIRIERDFGELPLVECLAGKINQVFMNIINNAIHAISDNIEKIKDPRILITTRAIQDSIIIEIGDNGLGMPESVKKKIFEPFFTTKAVGKGTGLGLSIVYSIIENHKGTLVVETEEGQGTTFIITLPIYQSTQRHE
jgi:two-component system NtrC family sensor kinase